MGTVVVDHAELFAGEFTKIPLLEDTVKLTFFVWRTCPALLTSCTVKVCLPAGNEYHWLMADPLGESPSLELPFRPRARGY